MLAEETISFNHPSHLVLILRIAACSKESASVVVDSPGKTSLGDIALSDTG